jgi:hypothetical protein
MRYFSVALLAASAFAQAPPPSSGWVVLPVGQYDALRAKAFPAPAVVEPPPVEVTLTRIDYDLRIVGPIATGRADLTIDMLKDDWVRIPVPSGLVVREATLDGKAVSLVPGTAPTGGNQLFAVFPARGRSVLALDVAVPIAVAAGEEKLSLPASTSSVTRASVTLSRQGVDVRVTGGMLSEKSDSAAECKWLAFGRGNESLTFTWRRKVEDHRVTLPTRLRGSLTELLGLGEDSTSIYVEVNLEVVQGAAHQARVQIPDKVSINQVVGAQVADWDAKGTELLVTFLEPVEKSAAFVIAGETRLPRDGEIDVPLLRLLDTERDSGGVAVEVVGEGEIKQTKPQGLDNVDAAELGPTVAARQSPSLTAFRFQPTAQRSLAVTVARYDQQAVLTANIEDARHRILMTSEGKTLIQARYAVRNSQRSFVRIALPAGAAVWSASVSGRPVRPGKAPDGGLLFPLVKARAGEEAPLSVVEVMYLVQGPAWAAKGQAALALPAVDLPVSRTGLLVYYPSTFRVAAEPGSFRTQAYEAPSGALAGAASAPVTAAQRPAAQPDLLQQLNQNATQAGTQALVDRFRARNEARRSAATLPIRISFPALGPSLFLVAELTGENQAPKVDFSFQEDRKGGAK